MADIDGRKIRKELSKPFGDKDVEWRISQAGRSSNGKVWAKVVCYVTSRAIQDRLDEVVGPENWRNEYAELPNQKELGQGCLCGLSIRIGDEWITKWDGANNTEKEPIKGGLSDAMKRAAVQWGLGRHLYGLGDNFAQVHENRNTAAYSARTNVGNKQNPEWVMVHWSPPMMADIKPRKHYGASDEPEGEELADAIRKTIAGAKNAKSLPGFLRRIGEHAQAGRLEAAHVKELEARVKMRQAELEGNNDPPAGVLFNSSPEQEGVGV